MIAYKRKIKHRETTPSVANKISFLLFYWMAGDFCCGDTRNQQTCLSAGKLGLCPNTSQSFVTR